MLVREAFKLKADSDFLRLAFPKAEIIKTLGLPDYRLCLERNKFDVTYVNAFLKICFDLGSLNYKWTAATLGSVLQMAADGHFSLLAKATKVNTGIEAKIVLEDVEYITRK